MPGIEPAISGSIVRYADQKLNQICGLQLPREPHRSTRLLALLSYSPPRRTWEERKQHIYPRMMAIYKLCFMCTVRWSWSCVLSNFPTVTPRRSRAFNNSKYLVWLVKQDGQGTSGRWNTQDPLGGSCNEAEWRIGGCCNATDDGLPHRVFLFPEFIPRLPLHGHLFNSFNFTLI